MLKRESQKPINVSEKETQDTREQKEEDTLNFVLQHKKKVPQ
jgi:hypothetical protein